MPRAACTCRYERLWFEPHVKGCPRHNDHSPARRVKRMLMRRHPSREGEWLCWPEVWGIDLYAMRFWNAGPGRLRVAYEVKVSRSDLLNELRRPLKRQRAMMLSHEFYFACPPGLMKPSEVPEGCGLVEVGQTRTTAIVRAPRREVPPLDEEQYLHLLRRDLFRETQPLLRRIHQLENHTVWQRSLLEKRDQTIREQASLLASAAAAG